MLNEYALRFYTLLEQSFKLDAADTLRQAMLSSIPYMEEQDRKQILDGYEHASRDIIEEIREEALESGAGIGKLKEHFR